jgi:hypothetical protein
MVTFVPHPFDRAEGKRGLTVVRLPQGREARMIASDLQNQAPKEDVAMARGPSRRQLLRGLLAA